MRIDERETRRIAALARLELDDASVRRYREQLGSVLGHAASLAELDLDDVPPTARAGRGAASPAADEPEGCLGAERATRGAVDAQAGWFRVPCVLPPDPSSRGDDDG